jgi:hypothetical protein
MAQAALHMLLAIITAYHGEQFTTVANEVLIFAPQLMARTNQDAGTMKRFLKTVWISYKSTLAAAAAHAIRVTTELPFGATLPSAVQQHLRGLPETFAENGIKEAVARALQSQHRRNTFQSGKTAERLLAAQEQMAEKIAEQAAQIRRLEQQSPAKAPAPSPHGVGAKGSKSGRSGSKANKKTAKAAKSAAKPPAQTGSSSGTSNATPTWRDVKLGAPEQLLAHADLLRKALFKNAKRYT